MCHPFSTINIYNVYFSLYVLPSIDTVTADELWLKAASKEAEICAERPKERREVLKLVIF